MNVLEYTLSLQDQMSSSLKKIGVNSDAALNKFAKLEQQSKEVKNAFKTMGTSVFTLKKKIDLLKAERDILPVNSLRNIKKYNREIDKLERKVSKLESRSGSKIGGLFKDAFKSLPAFATNPLILAGAGIGASIRKGFTRDMQMANITTLLKGDVEAAKKLFGQLTDYGIKTPYEKEDLVDSQKTMMSFGISADKSFESLKRIGDIAMGDSQKMKSLTLAFSQATSAGKLQGQDLLQMINAGFNPLNIISEKTGESMVSLKEKMAKGQISAQMMSQAFQWATQEGGLFYKAADKASQTLGGKWSNLMDQLTELMLKIYDVISPIVIPAIDGLIIVLGSLGKIISEVTEFASDYKILLLATAAVVGTLTGLYYAEIIALKLKNVQTRISNIREGISNVLLRAKAVVLRTVAGATLVWAGAQNVLNSALWKSPITWIVAAVVALGIAAAYVALKFDNWSKTWSSLMTIMQLKWKIFSSKFKTGWLGIKNAFMSGIDKIKIAWYKLKKLWDEDGAQKSIDAINKASDKRMAVYKKELQKQKELQEKSKKWADKVWNNEDNWLKWNKDKNVLDWFNGFFGGGSGIEPAKVPGTGDGSGDKEDEIKKTTNNIATGGTRNTQITLSFKNVVESLEIKKAGFNDSVQDMEKMVEDAFLRVLSTANNIAT